jgi:hypothetical protein
MMPANWLTMSREPVVLKNLPQLSWSAPVNCPNDSPSAAIRLADGLAVAVHPACSRAPSLVQSQRLVPKGPFRSPSVGERNGPLTGLETDGHVGTKAAPWVFAGRVKPSLDYPDQLDINYRDRSQLLLTVIPGSFSNYFLDVDGVPDEDRSAIEALCARYDVEIL